MLSEVGPEDGLGVEPEQEESSRLEEAPHAEETLAAVEIMQELGAETLEEAKKTIRDLRAKFRAQSHELMAWRRRVKQQEELIVRMNVERTERLRSLASQLLLFESRLCRKQRNISRLLLERETRIRKQQQLIHRLQACLTQAGLAASEETNLDSLNDSDSAVIMEDDDAYRVDVTVVRSISDALESKKQSQNQRRNNALLRRPEVLETVYSVEEDDQQPPAKAEAPSPEDSPPRARLKERSNSFEILQPTTPAPLPDDSGPTTPSPGTQSEPCHTAYNRVMSNHRSVTKPKDVKYKRINKAKSKSLEELRGKLKNWVDRGNKINISLDQSYA
ncbi:uncharacterized protein [Bemisia tabaci]|uniref:uncharacterized protein n=1 Tax=Bemisia tabaci TaxID=7038 RepID=UPI003B280221